MVKKIFWGLWMTVWPAVVLIPPLLTAQGPRPDAARDAAPIVTADGDATSAELVAPQPALVSDRAIEEPQLGAPQRDPFELKVSKSKTTAHRISQPRLEPAEKVFDAEAFEHSEPLPAVTTDDPAPATPEIARKPIRRSGPQLNAQEERAQKLIHERAMVRARQRQNRLAVKNWMQTTPRVVGRSTNWQPQLTQPNTLAEFDRIETPRDANYDIRLRD